MRFYPDDAHQPVLDWAHSRLQGTGRVADDLYLVAHHEVTGKPYLSSRAAGIGLAGGLLAELLTALRPAVDLESGYLFPRYEGNGVPVARYAPPDEPVVRHLLAQIIAESQPRPVRDWLLFLSRTAAANVAGRLEGAGYLIRSPSRFLQRTRRPVPVDCSWPVCALRRAYDALDAKRPLTPYAALLNSLTLACGLGFRFSGLSSEPARDAAELARILPPSLQELTACVQATADAAVLSART